MCSYSETPIDTGGVVNGTIYTAPGTSIPTAACPNEGTAVTSAVAAKAALDSLNAYNALVAFPNGIAQGRHANIESEHYSGQRCAGQERLLAGWKFRNHQWDSGRRDDAGNHHCPERNLGLDCWSRTNHHGQRQIVVPGRFGHDCEHRRQCAGAVELLGDRLSGRSPCRKQAAD